MDNEDSLSDIGPKIIGVMAFPNDPEIQFLHQLYKPSLETTKLKSEQGRTIFCEQFIGDGKLGPLSDLCARSLAKHYVANESIPFLQDDEQKTALYFESISVDLPLEKCCDISDDRYWRMVVKAKSQETALVEDANLKNRGISLRFVEFLEQQSVEFFVEKEAEALAKKIKEFVTDIHIRNLKSMIDRSFEEKLMSSDGESSDWEDDDETTSEPSFGDGASEVASDVQEDVVPTKSEEDFDTMGADGEEEEDEVSEKSPEELELELMEEEVEQAKEARLNAKNKALLAAENERRERHKKRREQRKLAAMAVPVKKKKKVKSIFDIPVSEDEDEDAEINDRRNLAKCIKLKTKYQYPPEDCHHISLRFVRFLDCLVSFTLEFQAKNLQTEYHTRYLNFSYMDMENLAYGISFLQGLKEFRLINSRMDAQKLEILTSTLQHLESLESVDFSNDQLEDDSCYGLFRLFRGTTSIKSLELRGNNLRDESLKKLAIALSHYGGKLNFLGLSQNPLGDEGLHSLVNALIKFDQVEDVNLSATHISQNAIQCCVVELLRLHKRLRRLDMIAVPMNELAALEFIKALTDNYTILHVDCRGCDLEFDIEFDVALIVKRNRYLLENPYIGDESKTAEDIIAFISQKKNPLYLRAMEAIATRNECLRQRPDEFTCVSEIDLETMNETSRASYQSALEVARNRSHLKLAFVDEPTILESNTSVVKPEQSFFYDTSKFDEDEFFNHVQQPGPDNRFMFFYKNRHTQEVEDEDEEELRRILFQ